MFLNCRKRGEIRKETVHIAYHDRIRPRLYAEIPKENICFGDSDRRTLRSIKKEIVSSTNVQFMYEIAKKYLLA